MRLRHVLRTLAWGEPDTGGAPINICPQVLIRTLAWGESGQDVARILALAVSGLNKHFGVGRVRTWTCTFHAGCRSCLNPHFGVGRVRTSGLVSLEATALCLNTHFGVGRVRTGCSRGKICRPDALIRTLACCESGLNFEEAAALFAHVLIRTLAWGESGPVLSLPSGSSSLS